MDLSLPEESQAFADVVADWARRSLGDKPQAWHHGAALDELGVFQLLGPDALDPDHQHLTVSLVLERLAAAGMTGPLAETVWALAHDEGADVADGWVGAPLDVTADGRALVPYGRRVARVLDASSPTRARPVDDLAPASLPMSEDGAWLPADHGTALQDLDPAFAWTAYASLTLGWCERLIDLALLQTRDRQAFGTSLLTFQAPRFTLVEAYQLVSGLRPAVRDVAWRLDRGLPGATAFAASAWVLAADVGRRVATDVHQVMGAASFPRETGVTPVTGAMAVLRLGNGVDAAVETLWRTWRSVAPDRPTSIGGVLSADTEPAHRAS